MLEENRVELPEGMQAPVERRMTKKALHMDDYKKRGALESDYGELITEPTVIYDEDEGRVKIVYLELVDKHKHLTAALKRIRYDTDSRTSGMMTHSRIFGYMPRRAIRRDYCHAASLARDEPRIHQMVMSYADQVARYYQAFNTDLYHEHEQMVEEILEDYKVGNSVFTSGIINKNNPLPYHHDSGNFKNVWSNMLVFKHRTAGGFLSVPEYDVGFELKNNSLLMFDGQKLLHGVTPIKRLGPEAHRFSIVFYSLQQMWKCESPEEEMARFRVKRTEREETRAQRDREKRELKTTDPSATPGAGI